MTMQIPSSIDTTRTPQWGALTFVLISVLAFNLSSLWGLVFLANIDIGFPMIDAPAGRAQGAAVAINLLLLTAFGLHHSVMARSRMRALTARFTGPLLERPFYILTAGAALMMVIGLWQPIPL